MPEPIEYVDIEDEEADWEELTPADPSTLPDNTDEWWCFFRWHGQTLHRQWPVSLCVTREITPPWRVGFGILVKQANGQAMAVGIWRRSKRPPSYQAEPRTLSLQKVKNRARKLGKQQR